MYIARLSGLLPTAAFLAIVPWAIDPSLATIVVSAFATAGGIVIAVLNGRNSTERLADKARIRVLEREVTRLGGDPDEL